MPRGTITKRSARRIAVPGGGVSFGATTQDLRVTLAADQTKATAGFAVLLTQAITLTAAQAVDVMATWAIAVSPGSIGALAIFVDGVQRQGSGAWVNNLVAQLSGGISHRETLAIGAHTITLQWQNVGGGGAGILCRPVANPDFEHASMRVQALTTVTVTA